MTALSIRQPWAWFILCGCPWWKDVENRTWPAPRDMIGRNFQIHAAKTMTPNDFGEALRFALRAGATKLPRFEDLRLGGIVGIVTLDKCVKASRSRWFVGPYGFVLSNPYPVPFTFCPGKPGFFEPLAI